MKLQFVYQMIIAAWLVTSLSVTMAVEVPLVPHDLSLWRDPEFKRQFLASYGVASNIEPSLTPEEQKLMGVLATLMGTDNGPTVVRNFLERAPQSGRSALLDFMLGNLLLQETKLNEAARWYETALTKFPSFMRAHKNLGLVKIRTGEYEKAVTALVRAIDLGDRDGLTYGLLGYAYAVLGKNTAAESAYRAAIMLQPESLDWKLGLSRILYKSHKYEEAATLCSELVAEYPSRPDLRLLLAGAYLGLKQNMRAAEVYEVLDAVGEATDDMLNTLGDIYVNENLFDLAADAYSRALQRGGATVATRAVRNAEVMVARGATREAGVLLEQLRKLPSTEQKPEDRIRILKLNARLAMTKRDGGDEQAKLLEEIINVDPLDGEAMILLAQHYAQKPEGIEKASLLFERAAAIAAYEAEAKLRQAQMLVRAGRFQEALPLIKRSQELRPRDDVARYLEQVERVARSRE